MSTDYHYVITLSKPAGSGELAGTYSGVIPVSPGMTRDQIYEQAKVYAASQDPELAHGNVLFFDLKPNQLPAEHG